MIRFAHSEFLSALIFLPLLVVLFWWAQRARRGALQRFGNIILLEHLMPGASGAKRKVRFFITVIALGALLVGLANPQIGTKLEEVKREGVDIFVCIDVSSSMKAEDIAPNRLESAKRQISLMLDKLQNDRIGLIVFAGDSYLQLPLTTDYGAARLFLSTIDVDVVPVPGTAIGSAIRLAMKSFVQGEQKHKTIVVITDGENHEDDAIAAAKDANEEGVVVHTIGMGSPAGAPIPVYQNNIPAGFKKDRDGTVVITKLDEATLQQIANTGSGKYVRATNQQEALGEIFREIQSMEKKEFGAKVFTEYEDRFQFFFLAVLVLLLIEFFLSERKSTMFVRWKSILPTFTVSKKEDAL